MFKGWFFLSILRKKKLFKFDDQNKNAPKIKNIIISINLVVYPRTYNYNLKAWLLLYGYHLQNMNSTWISSSKYDSFYSYICKNYIQFQFLTQQKNDIVIIVHQELERK